jgi:hypothetical protein
MVPPDCVADEWHLAVPVLREAVARSGGRHTMKTLLKMLMSGEGQMWGIYDNDSLVAVATTRIVDYPAKRFLAVDFIAGDSVLEWVEKLDHVLENFARDAGATAMEGVGRKGWDGLMRSRGWSRSMVVMEREVI